MGVILRNTAGATVSNRLLLIYRVILRDDNHNYDKQSLPHMCGGYSITCFTPTRRTMSSPYARGYSSIGILLRILIQSSHVWGYSSGSGKSYSFELIFLYIRGYLIKIIRKSLSNNVRMDRIML